MQQRRPALGRRLAAIRTHRMISQSELAGMIGTTKSVIYHCEHDHCVISVARLTDLAWALSCTVPDFLAPAAAPLPQLKPRRRQLLWAPSPSARE
jgi:transcriptional regulator with XRE-family HTH domain